MDFGVAIFVGVLGGLVGYLAQVLISVRNSEVLAISDQIADLKRIEEYAVAYWLADPSDKALNSELAARLRGAVMASSSFEEVGPDILGFRFQRYSELVLELDDIVTGGSFETDEKVVDSGRVVATMRTVGKIVSHLRVCRRYAFLWR